jgi:hypothetical protein
MDIVKLNAFTSIIYGGITIIFIIMGFMIRWLVKIHNLITDIRLDQKDIIIRFQNEYLKKDSHESICKERRRK